MKLVQKLRNNITFQIISGVVIVLAILTSLVSIVGYRQFTNSIVHQYANTAWHTAKTAETFVTPGFAHNPDYSSHVWKARRAQLNREWTRLVNTQGATFIYIFKVSGENYSRLEFLLSVENKASDIELFEPGHIMIMEDERFLNAYKAICEDNQERQEIAIYRQANKEQSGNNITVMIPIKDKQTGELWAILAVERPMSSLDQVRRNYLRYVSVIAFMLLIVVLTLYGQYLDQILLTPISKIAGEAIRFSKENTKLENSLADEIKTKNEIGQLAKTIDTMESNILQHVENLTRVTKEKEQIKAELNIATQIQADMLPRNFPPFPERKEFDIYATMTPAKEVGGDFYDFFLIDEDHLALVIADVSGKGVPAALFMVIAKTLIKNRAQMGGSPAEILGDVNNKLCEGNEAELFVTVWLGIVEISTGNLISSNAGHECPALKRSEGNFELVKTKHSPAVATMEGMKFRQTDLKLNPGDVLYVYTDGVAEATNSQNELYGTDRMLEALNRSGNASVEDLLTNMKSEVDNFTGDAPQFDDITMLCLKYYGKRITR